MNKKQIIRINENQLKQIIKESVNRALRESDRDATIEAIAYQCATPKECVEPISNNRYTVHGANEDADTDFIVFDNEEQASNWLIKQTLLLNNGQVAIPLDPGSNEVVFPLEGIGRRPIIPR